MGEVFIKMCAECGNPIEYTYENKSVRFCPDCRLEHRRAMQRERNRRHKEKKMLEAKAERIAHQQDATIWTHDYAERQKAKTLELVRGLW